ncbi:hypothetical protein J6590_000451 [Homalodisca vitripennis]|nr:hypothetical protein J6590_000451 [Homalodisca vitripennis]
MRLIWDAPRPPFKCWPKSGISGIRGEQVWQRRSVLVGRSKVTGKIGSSLNCTLLWFFV